METVKKNYNAYCTPKSFFVHKYLDIWDLKIHGPCNYLQSFNVADFIDKFKTTKHYPLVMFRNGISKNMRSYVTGKMDDGIPSPSSNSAMTSTKEENRSATFKIQIKKWFIS